MGPVLVVELPGLAQGVEQVQLVLDQGPLEPLGLEAVHPDDFLLDQLDLSPPTLLQVIREQAAHTRRPPLTPRDLATLLGWVGVPDFADEILRLMATPLDGT